MFKPYQVLTVLAGTLLLSINHSQANVETQATQLQNLLVRKGLSARTTPVEHLEMGQVKTYKTRLLTQTSYLFGATGDENIADIDVAVYDQKGQRLAIDEDKKNVAVAATKSIAFSQDGFIRVRIESCKPGKTGGKYALVIANN